jgi:ribA/ribD-fused uncharacterized protein
MPPTIPHSTAGPVDPRRWRRASWDEPGTIYFWSGRTGEHQAFSNFNEGHAFPMTCWLDPTLTVEMPDGEHAFQTAKAATMAQFHRICPPRVRSRPRRAGGRGSIRLPADWNQRRAQVMLAVVRAKFADGELRELLDCTGEHLLAEDSSCDSLWGCRDKRGGYTGQNLLGRALMRVRDGNRGLLLR